MVLIFISLGQLEVPIIFSIFHVCGIMSLTPKPAGSIRDVDIRKVVENFVDWSDKVCTVLQRMDKKLELYK